MKCCSKCRTTKRGADFYRDARARDGLYSHCKKCQAGADAAWRKKNPKRNAEIGRNSKLKSKFGLTPEGFEKLVVSQDNQCAICRRRFLRGRDRHVDHDHTTGIVRGLLCSNCNTGMGLLDDSPERLRAAAAYLEACATLEVVAVSSTG